MEDPVRFYEELDQDVERAGLPVHVLLTDSTHRRSSQELVERYGGTTGRRPEGVEIGAEALSETVYWLPEHAALVCGDVILGRGGGLSVPRPWVGDRYDEAVEALRPLLELPVERVLVTHGEPVLAGALEALERALAG